MGEWLWAHPVILWEKDRVEDDSRDFKNGRGKKYGRERKQEGSYVREKKTYDMKHVLNGKTQSQQVKGLDPFQNSKTREKYNMNMETVKPQSTTFVN